MDILKKIAIVLFGCGILITVVSLTSMRINCFDFAVNNTHKNMQTILNDGESVLDSYATLNKNGSFDDDYLLEELQKHKNYQDSKIFKTVPVVAAWNTIAQNANLEGYKFRVVSKNARNKDHSLTEKEKDIYAKLEANQFEDYQEISENGDEIIYARAVRLEDGCLKCHGNPANSPNGDGTDVLGFKMENYKVGDVAGAYILSTKTHEIDQLLNASFNNTFGWIIAVVILSLIGGYVYTKVYIVKPFSISLGHLNGGIQRLSSNYDKLQKLSYDVASGASGQASAIEQTSAGIQQIYSQTEINKDNSLDTSTLAEESLLSLQNLANEIKEMTTVMADINNSSEQIREIAKTIEDIAFQTNLLSLNANVEAARAGEAGAGFAVVADEVRSLAKKSAESAKLTDEKIDNAVSLSKNAVLLAETVISHSKQTEDFLKKLTANSCDLKASSEEQVDGIKQIKIALEDIEKVTLNNAQASDQTNIIAKELSDLIINIEDASELIRKQIGN